MTPGKKKVGRKPLSELYMNFNFTEDREAERSVRVW